MSIKKVNPKYIIKRFTDLVDTPDTLIDDKVLVVNDTNDGIEFSNEVSNIIDENIEELSIDYISGFSMQSCNPDTNGLHEGIRVNKGFLEIAEPGDLSNDTLWDSRISKMIFNIPNRNLFKKDISGFKDSVISFTHRRYDANYNWGNRNIQCEPDGDNMLYRFDGNNSDFLYRLIPYDIDGVDFDYNTTKQLTISCKVKLYNLNAWQTILSDSYRNTSAYVEGSFWIMYYPESDTTTPGKGFRFYIPNNNNTTRLAFFYDCNVELDTWYHLIFQVDLNDINNCKLFINNNEVPMTYLDDNYNLRTFATNRSDCWFTIGGYLDYRNNYMWNGLIKSIIMIGRLLNSSERQYLYENEYCTRPYTTSPNSDIYELEEDVIIDTNDLDTWVLNDGTDKPLHGIWYYIYALAGSNNKAIIRISQLCPIRNRYGVENEGYNMETLYHPFLNARCIGVFKYDNDRSGLPTGNKVRPFMMRDGQYQYMYHIQLTHNSTTITNIDGFGNMWFPGNIYRFSIRTYRNAKVYIQGGLNWRNQEEYNYNRNHTPGAAVRTFHYLINDYHLSNFSSTIFYGQYGTKESSAQRVYLSIPNFSFKQ